MKLLVRDVTGPLPNSDLAVAFLLDSNGKMIALPCSLSDADACRKALDGESANGPSLYYYMLDLLKKTDLELAETWLEGNGDGQQAYSKVVFRNLKDGAKPTKIVSSNPMIAVNFSLVSGRDLLTTEALVSPRRDILALYGHLKSSFSSLWPLSAIRYTEQVEVLSELVDETKCQAQAT